VVNQFVLSKNVKVRIYKTVILPLVLYGCVTWSLDSKGGSWTEGVREQGAEENIGPKRDEMTGG
jgi:hypothetical protein